MSDCKITKKIWSFAIFTLLLHVIRRKSHANRSYIEQILRMRKTLLLLLLWVSGASLWAMGAELEAGRGRLWALRADSTAYPDGQFRIYRLALKDKRGTAHTLKHPEKFLSEKALERRYRQGLQVDSTDLPLSERYLRQLAERGFHVIGGSKWNNTVLVKTARTAATDLFTGLPFVAKVTRVFTTPDSIRPERIDSVVADTAALRRPRTHRYGLGQSQIDMLNGARLHAAGFRGEGKLIAIIDGGFMNADKIGYLQQVNIVGQRDMVYPYQADVYRLLDHGTMVLSDMAAHADSLFVGTAPGASFLLLRSEDGRTENLVEEDYWAQAAEYADSVGADIINSSLGYHQFDDKAATHQYREQDGHTALISRTASMLARKGMILVNSAGNEGMRSWKRIGCPGDAEDVLTVAALNKDSVNAAFSSVGPSIDGRVKPDVASRGVGATVIDGSGVITQANGTSFATPILCGMVACLWQALPGKTASQIMDLVRKAGSRADHPDNVFGYGIPDFWKAYQAGLGHEPATADN